jgi:hypothetical protein
MAFLWMDGFDHYTTNDLQRIYDDKVDAVVEFQIDNSITRYNSSGSLYLPTELNNTQAVLKHLPSYPSTFIAGFGFRWNGASIRTANVFKTYDMTPNYASQVGLQINGTTNTLSFYRGTSILGTSTVFLREDTWYFIELKCTINNTTGAYEVRVNGQNILSATSVDTQQTANARIATAGFVSYARSSNDSRNQYWDDFYLLDDTGDFANDFLGESRVATLFPNANGNFSNFIGSDGNSNQNFRLVDANPHNSGTNYVESNTSGAIDTYRFETLPSKPIVSGIYGVKTTNFTSKDEAGTKSFRNVVRVSGENYFGSGDFNYPSFDSYDVFYDNWSFNPANTGIWDEQTINSIQAGFEVEQ